MANPNPSIRQYPPLRIPSNWGAQEKKFILQLTDILDDIYRRYGRFKLTDLGVELQELVAGTISADRIDVDNLYVKHLDAADGTFTGTSTIVNPLNGNEQIIIGLNGDGDFGGFITRDNGATFIKWLNFDGLDGSAIIPGSFDPLAVPTFSYTGDYVPISDGTSGWRIKFLTSGTFTPDDDMTVDAFLVGGGAGSIAGGGGGGYTTTQSSIVLTGSVGYPIVVGDGGTGGSPYASGTNDGKQSTAFGYSANGGVGSGYDATTINGGPGGSGGGGYAGTSVGTGGAGGSDSTSGAAGSGGNTSNGTGGAGQGTTTKEFGESTGDLYAGGGGGYGASVAGAGGSGGGGDGGYGSSPLSEGQNGTANTGGGAGGFSADGGSGIVIIRNHRA